MKGMLEYYNQWRFKHPTPSDFKKIMEHVSGIELDWYLEQFIGTTNFVDYAVDGFEKCKNNSTQINLSKKGDMPMPLDIVVTLTDGSQKVFNIPLQIMRGAKTKSKYTDYKVVSDDWPWTNPTFALCVDIPTKNIKSIEIDPSLRLADIDKSDNIFPRKEATE